MGESITMLLLFAVDDSTVLVLLVMGEAMVLLLFPVDESTALLLLTEALPVDDSIALLLLPVYESAALFLLTVDEAIALLLLPVDVSAASSSFVAVPLFKSMNGTGCRSSSDNIVMLLIFVASIGFLLR